MNFFELAVYLPFLRIFSGLIPAFLLIKRQFRCAVVATTCVMFLISFSCVIRSTSSIAKNKLHLRKHYQNQSQPFNFLLLLGQKRLKGSITKRQTAKLVHDGSWLRLFVYTVYIFRDKTDEDKRTNTDSKRGFQVLNCEENKITRHFDRSINLVLVCSCSFSRLFESYLQTSQTFHSY